MTEKIINNHLPIFSVPEKVMKGWGYEIWIANTHQYCGKILHYDRAGIGSSIHFHPIKSEVFYVVAGRFELTTFDQDGRRVTKTLSVGHTVQFTPGTPHGLVPLDDHSEIFEVSTPHSDDDVVRIAPGASQKPCKLKS